MAEDVIQIPIEAAVVSAGLIPVQDTDHAEVEDTHTMDATNEDVVRDLEDARNAVKHVPPPLQAASHLATGVAVHQKTTPAPKESKKTQQHLQQILHVLESEPLKLTSKEDCFEKF